MTKSGKSTGKIPHDSRHYEESAESKTRDNDFGLEKCLEITDGINTTTLVNITFAKI